MLKFWSGHKITGRPVAAWIISGAAAAALMTTGATAQITTVDPNTVLDADLDGPKSPAPKPPADAPADYLPPSATTPPSSSPNSSNSAIDPNSDLITNNVVYDDPAPQTPPLTTTDGSGTTTAAPTDQSATGIPATLPTSGSNTYQKDDLIGAAEGVFGKGAQGLAQMIQDLLAKQGEPNGYIVGREASGALVVGLRYGSGRLYHKIEGERDVYWTGPSVGFDTGGNASRTFVLVYNLYDTQELYKRFPAGEGNAYLVGGLTASYMRSGDVVLIPIRMGVGMRLGVNAGYMKFTEKRKWMPF